eukprot:505443_1
MDAIKLPPPQDTLTAVTCTRTNEIDHSITSIYLKQYGTPTVTEDNNPPIRKATQNNITVYDLNQDNTEEEMHWSHFKLYTLWNVIRFAIIAGLVCLFNYQNQPQIQQNSQYCCNCYYVARNPEFYGIAKNTRIDWSYCMPACVDCTYCRTVYNDSANASFAVANQTCPAQSYDAPPSKPLWDWDQDCPHTISITTLGIFLTDYTAHGLWIFILVLLYISYMTSFIFCCTSYAKITSGASLLVYNVIVSINAVYAMFKPMQYIHQEINNTPHQTICEVDTINETMEDVMSWCVLISFVFILSQWIIGAFGCFMTRKAMFSNSGSRLVPYKIRIAYVRFEKLMIASAIVLAVVFYVTLIVASTLMIGTRLDKGRQKQDAWKITFIITVDFLCILSCIDVFCFPFCRNTTIHYFGRKTDDPNEHKTYRDLWGQAIDESDSLNTHFLDETVKQAEL